MAQVSDSSRLSYNQTEFSFSLQITSIYLRQGTAGQAAAFYSILTTFFYIYQNFPQSFLFTSNFNTWLLSNHLADSPLLNKLFQGALFKVDG